MERTARKLVFLCLIAALFGLALIFSATRYDPKLRSAVIKQAAALVLGLTLTLPLPFLDLRAFCRRFWWMIALGNVTLLLLLLPLGNDNGTGNRSWIALPGGWFNFQPAEFVKVGFLLLLALQLDLQRKKGLDRPVSILLLVLHGSAMAGLVYIVSGDMGMTAVFLALWLIVLWSGGVRGLWMTAVLLTGAAGGVLLWPRLPDYVRLRFLVVLDHELDPLGKGFQQGRSLLALGSGGLTGQGFLHGTQTQSPSASALPARHTDLIFSAAGEELGFSGCLIILSLLSIMIFLCVRLSARCGDPFLRDVSMGTAGMLAVQTILNVGMCLYAVPVVGVTLPFFSYGGSSLVSFLLAAGILRALAERPTKGRIP